MRIDRIYIPSRGRYAKGLTTPYALPEDMRRRVRVVVPRDEYMQYEARHPELHIIKRGKDVHDVGKARQWILDYAHDNGDEVLCQFDDDITGLSRKEVITQFGTVRKASPEKWWDVIKLWEGWLDRGFAQVGIADRATSARTLEPWTENGRAFKTLVFNLPLLKRHDYRFDRLRCHVDIDIALQLIRNGHPQRVSTRWSFNAASEYTNPGGCATYRTDRVIRRESARLIELHPGIVTPYHHQTSIGITYKRVSWAKAAQEGGLK